VNTGIAFRGWLRRTATGWLTHRRDICGFPTVVVNTRSDVDTAQVFARLEASLRLIEQYVPHHYRRFPQDFSGFLVERRAYRGAFILDSRTCLVELTFVVNPAFSLAQVAATILHEAMHARLYARRVALTDSPRQERFCRRAEIEFGSRVPGGEAIVQRALASLTLPNDEIAPAIDPVLAARRVAEVDLAVSSMPVWLKRTLICRRGLTPPGRLRGLPWIPRLRH